MSLLQKPPALKPGDCIEVVAPASPFDANAFAEGLKRLESWGFRVKCREDIFSRKRYLAGEDARRAEELIQALQNPDSQAVFTARGGYGCLRLLPYLDAVAKPPPPKILLGYSDITTLLMYVHQRWNWVSFHGPVVAKDIGARLRDQGEASLLRCLTQAEALGTLRPEGLKTLHPGRAEAPLVGGCLTLIVCSLGTPYQLQTQGKILYLEDVGELLYSLDRMLTHLRLAGLFRDLKGLVIGPLQGAHDSPEIVEAMLRDTLGDLEIPTVLGFPSGHQEDSWTLPLGLPVLLDADAASLTFTESALRA